MRHNLATKIITEKFDRAAGDYDQAASVQEQIAAHLVRKALGRLPEAPRTILDIGCGTGFVAEVASRAWPLAHISAIDGAPAMLEEARCKLPHLRTLTGDIATIRPEPVYDLILSSMALHWSPDTLATLLRWQRGLKPKGRIFVALLVEGSFREWRELCASQGLANGLWELPLGRFACELATEIETQTLTIDYPSARDFLLRLKATGAATPHPEHRPLDPAAMRRLLAVAPEPFAVTYRVLYIEAPSPNSI